jgi:hypothetical protein
MVTRKCFACYSLILVALCLSLFVAFMPLAGAQGITYSVSREWVKVWVNTDRSVYVLYNISFTYLSGSPQGVFTVGMPKGGFQIQYVEDFSGSPLQYQDSSQGSFYGVDVHLKQPIVLNQPYTFVVYAMVPAMIYPDNTNPGNFGLQFYPSTFLGASGSENLRVEILLPPGVKTNEAKSPEGLLFDNVFVDENRTAVYWERISWSPDQVFNSGVSFPEQYVSPAPSETGPLPTPTQGGGTSSAVSTIIGVLVFLGVAIVIVAVFAALAKATYIKPSISVEALGANRGLTAVEAGLVLGLKPVRVLTMMLYGLLLKRMVAVTETEPLLKLKKLELQTGELAPSPRYYEIDYLNAIKPDGQLDEKTLALTYQGLVNAVNQKLRGYSREDTLNYYKSIVDKAWMQVTQAGTPELKGDALDKNLDWLLVDEKFDDRFTTIFPPNILIIPNPAWWWYWGGPRSPSGQPRAPSPTAPPVPTKPVSLPGQDFANNVVRGLQSASNNMVKNIQDFANRLAPFQPAPSNQSVSGRPSCVCACHACACACACVSCACACAGGGAH